MNDYYGANETANATYEMRYATGPKKEVKEDADLSRYQEYEAGRMVEDETNGYWRE